MPHSETHKRKLKKNLTVMGLVFAWCALIWAVTMVRIAHGADIEKSYIGPRTEHRQDTEDTLKKWHGADWQDKAEERDKTKSKMDASRAERLESTGEMKKSWDQKWADDTEIRAEETRKRDQQRQERLEESNANPAIWWKDWEDRLNP